MAFSSWKCMDRSFFCFLFLDFLIIPLLLSLLRRRWGWYRILVILFSTSVGYSAHVQWAVMTWGKFWRSTPLSKKEINTRKSKKRKQQCIGDALSWPSSPSLSMAITEGPRKTTGKRCHRIGRTLADLEKRGVYERADFFCMYWLCMCTRVQLYVSVCVVMISSNCQNSTMQMQPESEDEENLDFLHQRKATREIFCVPVSQSKRWNRMQPNAHRFMICPPNRICAPAGCDWTHRRSITLKRTFGGVLLPCLPFFLIPYNCMFGLSGG